MSDNKEVYFVGSNDEYPEKIFFNKIEAFAFSFGYIDSFDENGDFVKSYIFDGEEYNEDF